MVYFQVGILVACMYNIHFVCYTYVIDVCYIMHVHIYHMCNYRYVILEYLGENHIYKYYILKTYGMYNTYTQQGLRKRRYIYIYKELQIKKKKTMKGKKRKIPE